MAVVTMFTMKTEKTSLEAHYICDDKGWKGCPQDCICHGASEENTCIEERVGKSDMEILKKLGMCSQQMQKQDVLFFYQCLFPMCGVSKLGVGGDKRNNLYTDLVIL
eukprot:6644294-Ditylum_brightwellii.AAC.2